MSEDEHLLDDETPIVNGPVKVKRITTAQRNRMKETNRLKAEIANRKRERQHNHLLDQ